MVTQIHLTQNTVWYKHVSLKYKETKMQILRENEKRKIQNK